MSEPVVIIRPSAIYVGNLGRLCNIVVCVSHVILKLLLHGSLESHFLILVDHYSTTVFTACYFSLTDQLHAHVAGIPVKYFGINGLKE